MKKAEISTDGRLTMRTRLGFGVGDFGANLVFQSTLIFLIFYFTDVFGIATATAGTIFLVAKVWDAVSDPVVGYLSDRTRTGGARSVPTSFSGLSRSVSSSFSCSPPRPWRQRSSPTMG